MLLEDLPLLICAMPVHLAPSDGVHRTCLVAAMSVAVGHTATCCEQLGRAQFFHVLTCVPSLAPSLPADHVHYGIQ
jgi:hypothetical protein